MRPARSAGTAHNGAMPCLDPRLFINLGSRALGPGMIKSPLQAGIPRTRLNNERAQFIGPVLCDTAVLYAHSPKSPGFSVQTSWLLVGWGLVHGPQPVRADGMDWAPAPGRDCIAGCANGAISTPSPESKPRHRRDLERLDDCPCAVMITGWQWLCFRPFLGRQGLRVEGRCQLPGVGLLAGCTYGCTLHT